ncbi:UvrD-helicase domain-containing protein [Nocardia asteroides]|uniref:UvrD-helicase domain-containing protein n=1 Tax=Nocardia asteroides TaxID=1824 RepID=UPI001E321D07|nr:UvrD-helicase domain-containing protein [Nocardia asteroides]UGT56508.1 AAA family ATPase [Nocardia asteroides]
MTSSNDREILRRRIESEITDAVGELPGRSKNIYTALLLDGRRQWRLLLHRTQPAPPSRCDGLFVGPRGVFALNIVDELPGEAQIRRLRAQAEQLFTGVTIAPHGNEFVRETVELVFVLPVGRPPNADGRFVVTTDATLRSLLTRDRVMTAAAADALAEHTGRRSTDYQVIPTVPSAQLGEPDGLLEVADLRADQVTHALSKPFPSWLAFLDPAQNALVSRNYNGPARIVGPAGSGKTVLALHRMAHRARRTTGPLLFTTLVRNLPPYQEVSFARLMPDAAGRAEFTNLHAWAQNFLAARGKPRTMELTRTTTAFNRAWAKSLRASPLSAIERAYWREEIDRVIKGRGLPATDDGFAEYAEIDRRGRRVALRPRHRRQVWDLYEAYEEIRIERQCFDGNDVIAAALDELRARPLPRPYAMVVVDEVQDMTLQSLRLVHAMTGDETNSLLFVGDRQQQIYAGGWRFVDAGINIVGRSEKLTKNYRNRRAILKLAASLPGARPVEDFDTRERHSLDLTEAALPDGIAERWVCTRAELYDQIRRQLDRIVDLGIPLADTAIITITNAEAETMLRHLRQWGIAAQELVEYRGAPTDTGVKVGTVYRAKGLDFRAVVHPFAEPAPPTTDAEHERYELTMRQQFVAVTRARDFVWLGVVRD